MERSAARITRPTARYDEAPPTPAADCPRLGPRPLALHVARAERAWREHEPDRLAAFFRGVQAYRGHPYRRRRASKPAIWRSGATTLRDYGPSDGVPLLVIPSLINRAYVLDLMPGSSLLAFLGENGLRPLLLDWGEPGAPDRRLSLDSYILDRLEGAFDWLSTETGKRPLLLGYCMGGTLAMALANRRPADCPGLALLAAPWDFSKSQFSMETLRRCGRTLADCSGSIGGMPVDWLQTMFTLIDPMAVPAKYAAFAKLDRTSATARRFVAIEDWLNDGVPLGADLATQCFEDWYGRNAPAGGTWKVAGDAVTPEAFDNPAFLAIPAKDRIVPAASALALADALPNATVIRPASGHIGMVAGRYARIRLWKPLLAWLLEIAAMQN